MICRKEQPVFAEGAELAAQDFGLPFNALEQAFARMIFSGVGRFGRGLLRPFVVWNGP